MQNATAAPATTTALGTIGAFRGLAVQFSQRKLEVSAPQSTHRSLYMAIPLSLLRAFARTSAVVTGGTEGYLAHIPASG